MASLASDRAAGYAALLEQQGRIGPNDVLKFRREVFTDGLVNQSEADALLVLNETHAQKCDEWREFYVEALTDYIVNQAEPRGYVSDANADWLIAGVSRDGHVESATELELLVKVLDRAQTSLERLSRFVLDEIGRACIEGEGPLARAATVQKGVIEEAEVELIRRVLYAFGGDSGIAISKAEAEFLFDLNDRTIQSANHPAWQELFVKAIANYLMAAATGHNVSRVAALKREEWLEDTNTNVASTVLGAFGALGQMFSGAFLADMSDAHGQIERAWAERNERVEAEMARAATISDAEAQWVIDRLTRDGVVHENEKALLRFLRSESPDIHPELTPWLNKAGAA